MYDIENSIGFLLAKAHQRGWALFSAEISKFDLTPPQFSVLAFLWQQDRLTQSELSEKTQIDRTTLGGLIDRLEKLGMLQRTTHPQDRRAHLICLTDKARSHAHELTRLAQQVIRQQRDIFRTLGQRRNFQVHDVQAVVKIFTKLIARHYLW